ncbi:MAG: RnfABCDGE type electron transport complex subunit D [Acidobacteriota bacterium]
MNFPDKGHSPDPRLTAMRRFALTITLFVLAGHSFLGFEQSFAHPLIALAFGYGTALLLEWVDSRSKGRQPGYGGGLKNLVYFLLPVHIGSLAISMLLYSNDRLLPLAFAVTVAVASKYLFRIQAGPRSCHFFNPSNLGIAATLVIFPWVGIAPPYMFTENLSGLGDWILPLAIIVLGGSLNYQFTRRMPLILAWLGGFALQALVRSFFREGWLFWDSFLSGLIPMTGVAFVLFTFYMITDPATSPFKPRGQVAFGLSVAAAYGLLVAWHQVFGLFFGLTLVCGLRGLILYLQQQAIAQRVWARLPLPGSASEPAR